MVLTKCWCVVLVFFKLINTNNAVTHWVVTDTGRIQAYIESPYDMRRPYDLLALMEQEKRHDEINSLYNNLLSRKNNIEEKWSKLEGTANIGNKITANDPDCLAAGKLFSNIDLYGNIASNGTHRGIKIVFSNYNKDENNKYTLIPDCIIYAKSDGTYINDNIPKKSTIRVPPDESLKDFMPVDSLKYYAHQIGEGLEKNSTSWVHYNLAGIYWRIVGEGSRSIECIKRAIYYVPLEFRDIPLHNLAGILHQARHSKEAAFFLTTAIQYSPKESMHYLALGNIFASLGNYNKSVQFYDQFLELKPGQKDVVANRHATLCYWKLETGLIRFQESLQGILTDLHTYHSEQQQWLRLQERLVWEHSSHDVQLNKGIHDENLDIPNSKKFQRCVQKKTGDSNTIISCDLHNKGPDVDTLNVENLFQYVENEKKKLNDHMAKPPNYKKDNENDKEQEKLNPNDKKKLSSKIPPLMFPKFPTTNSNSKNEYFDVTGWPTKEECLDWKLPILEKDTLKIPIYLPPENKGFQIQKAIGDYINLPKGSQHELPWYPPVCDRPDADGDKYLPPGDKSSHNMKVKPADSLMTNHLYQYVADSNADEAEIGQRIITAMEKNTLPKWTLATVASLYWRVRGNAKKALDCLDLAFQMVPKDFTDVVLVSIGSLVHELGYNDQALKFAALAFKINYVEPSTNFLLAIIHYSKNNPLLAMYYMKNVLRSDPNFYGGKAEFLLKTWACRVKLGGNTPDQLKKDDPKIECPKNKDKEPLKGEGILCKNGGHCKQASLDCYQKKLNDDIEKGNEVDKNCEGEKQGLGYALISTLLQSESKVQIGRKDGAEDQKFIAVSQYNADGTPQSFHMRLALGDKHPAHEHAGLGDFLVSVAVTEDANEENLLQVYDQHGTYSLSPTGCKNLQINQDFTYSSVWPSLASRSIDITPFLKAVSSKDKNKKPYCRAKFTKGPITLKQLKSMNSKSRLPSSPDQDLSELLGLMASDRRATVDELGSKIANALKNDETSWMLTTASAIYWRIVGNSEEAITCFKLALSHVPNDMRDVPLISLAALLNRVGFHGDALEIAYLALSTHNNFVLNHFTIGNIHIAMGELEKSVMFYRACLALDSNFTPARWRLQAVLCTMLFDESNNNKYETRSLDD